MNTSNHSDRNAFQNNSDEPKQEQEPPRQFKEFYPKNYGAAPPKPAASSNAGAAKPKRKERLYCVEDVNEAAVVEEKPMQLAAEEQNALEDFMRSTDNNNYRGGKESSVDDEYNVIPVQPISSPTHEDNFRDTPEHDVEDRNHFK